MENIIKLDNNYNIKIVNKIDEIPQEVTSIVNPKSFKILKIDFNEFDKKDYKKLLKKLLHIKKKNKKNQFGIDENGIIIIAYILNFDKNSRIQNDFIAGINAIFYDTKYDRYNYIYDNVCAYLDDCFYSKNMCDFKNNKCGTTRNSSCLIGCCRHYRNKVLGPLTKFVPCEHLNPKTYKCDAKCISCKLFTCHYLESKGIKFKINDFLLLNTFFNPIQKYFIKCMVYTPKEKILKRLVKL